MTKIKNFRLTPRPREIARILKHQSPESVVSATEAVIDQFVQECSRFISPAAVYLTLPRVQAEKTISLPLSDKAVAVTLVVVTIGPGIAQEQAEAQSKGDSLRSALLNALQAEALQQSVQFIARLLHDQGKKEDCEISAAFDVQDSALVATFLELLGTSRIGVTLNDSLQQMPLWSRAAWMLWTTVAQGRKGESASRAPKTALRR